MFAVIGVSVVKEFAVISETLTSGWAGRPRRMENGIDGVPCIPSLVTKTAEYMPSGMGVSSLQKNSHDGWEERTHFLGLSPLLGEVMTICSGLPSQFVLGSATTTESVEEFLTCVTTGVGMLGDAVSAITGLVDATRSPDAFNP